MWLCCVGLCLWMCYAVFYGCFSVFVDVLRCFNVCGCYAVFMAVFLLCYVVYDCFAVSVVVLCCVSGCDLVTVCVEVVVTHRCMLMVVVMTYRLVLTVVEPYCCGICLGGDGGGSVSDSNGDLEMCAFCN